VKGEKGKDGEERKVGRRKEWKWICWEGDR